MADEQSDDEQSDDGPGFRVHIEADTSGFVSAMDKVRRGHIRFLTPESFAPLESPEDWTIAADWWAERGDLLRERLCRTWGANLVKSQCEEKTK